MEWRDNRDKGWAKESLKPVKGVRVIVNSMVDLISHWAQVLVTQLDAKKKGFSDVVYLDAKSDTYLEEVSSCNIFIVKGKTIKTPPLQGTILPGVTRR